MVTGKSAKTNKTVWLLMAALLGALFLPLEFAAAAPGDVLRIQDGLGQAALEVNNPTFTADEPPKQLCAALFSSAGAFLGNPNANWRVVSKTGQPGQDIGTLSNNQVPCVSFDPRFAGQGTIAADDGAFHTDTTGTTTVVPGILNNLKIRDLPNGAGNEVNAVDMTADQALTLWVAGYDADTNFKGDQAGAVWSVTVGSGGPCGILNPAAGANTNFQATAAADVARNCRIQAVVGAVNDPTGLVTVTPGRLASLQIRDSPNNGGAVVNAFALNADQTKTVFAAGFDADNNYRGDEPAAWSVLSNNAPCGSVSPPTGTSTTFDAGLTSTPADDCRVHARSGAASADARPINVGPGTAVASMKIRDAAGADLAAAKLTADETLTLFAAGFDSAGNAMGNVAGTVWSLSDPEAGTLTPAPGSASATLEPKKAGTLQVTATKGAVSTASGPIAVTPGLISKIIIQDAPGPEGQPVGALSLTADQVKALFASGYDADDNYAGEVLDAVWTTANFACGALTPTTGPAVILDAKLKSDASKNCQVIASSGPKSDSTGTITVSPGLPVSIGIQDASGNPVGAIALDTADFAAFRAVGTDLDGNVVGDVSSAAWAVENPCGTLNSMTGAVVVFDPTIISPADKGCRVRVLSTSGAATATTGTITVTGTATQIKIRSAANNGGQEVGPMFITTDDSPTLFAAAYDKDFNYLGDAGAATWTMTANPSNAATLTAGVGQAVLEAKKAGTLTVTASLVVGGTTLTDSTGIITIALGALNNLKIRDAANGAGAEVGTFTINSNTAKALFAAGYDGDGNFLGDRSVRWSVVNECGTVDPATGASTTFTAGLQVVANCVVQAMAGCLASVGPDCLVPVSGVIVDRTDAITINPPPVDAIKIRTAANNGGEEVGDLTLTADESVTLFAAGYAGGVFLGDRAVTWSDPNGLGSFAGPNPATSIVFNADHTGTGAVHATLGAVTDPTGTVTVNTGVFAQLVFGTVPSSTTAGVAFGTTVTAEDADSNVKTDFSGLVHFTVANDAAATIPADYTYTTGAGQDNGAHAFAFTLKTVNGGAKTITATSGAITKTTSAISVVPNAMTKFTLSCVGACPVDAGVQRDVKITAKDNFANTITTYAGAKSVTLTGANAAPKGDVPQCGGANVGSAMAAAFVNGEVTVTCNLKKAEAAALSVSASTDGFLTTAALSITVNPAAAQVYRVALDGEAFNEATGTTTGAPAALTAGADSPVTLRALDTFWNLVKSGGNNWNGDKTVVFSGAPDAFDGTKAEARNKNGLDQVYGEEVTIAFTNGVGQTRLTLYRAAANQVTHVESHPAAAPVVSGDASPATVSRDIVVQFAILDCAATNNDQNCILATDHERRDPVVGIGQSKRFFGALVDSYDNLDPTAALADWTVTGSTLSANSCRGSATSIACDFNEAGAFRVTASRAGTTLGPSLSEFVVA